MTRLSVYSRSTALFYFLVYVDDPIITIISDPSLFDTIIRQLDSTFSTKDLGPLSYFRGVKVLDTSSGLLLSQHMLGSKLVSTPLVVGTSLTSNDGFTPVNAFMYRQVISDLQHLQFTQMDISFVVNKLSQFMHASSEHHWGVIKVYFVILVARDPLVFGFLKTLLRHCTASLMRTGLVTKMIVPP